MGNPARSPGERTDWRRRAACRDEDPELFFPVGTTGPAAGQVARARAVCARCPVAVDCLYWAVETGQEAGIWGGTTEDDRDPLARAYAGYLQATAALDETLREREAPRDLLTALADEAALTVGAAMAAGVRAPEEEVEAAAAAATAARQVVDDGLAAVGMSRPRLWTAAHRVGRTLPADPAAPVVPSAVAG